MTDERGRDESRELDAIEAVVRSHPNGVSLSEIMKILAGELGIALARRTVTRRLNALEATGRIRSVGRTTAARYFVGTIEKASTPSSVTPDDYVPLSAAGASVRDLVRQPMVKRSPVGYNEAFLHDYTPGVTWYLPLATREWLHEHGRTSDSERPAGTFARDVFERLLIDLAWASSRLEGNTYSLLETKNLLTFGLEATGKDAAEAQMIVNHKKAIEMLVEHAGEIDFSRHTILNVHAALADNLMDDANDEGRVRTRMVGVTGTAFVPLSIPQKLDELLDVILEKVSVISDPFEQSFFMMVHLPYLQPFADVNKRTSRLAANISLIKANLCPLSFLGVPQRAYVEGTLAVYEFNRVELLRDVYVWAYERSCTQYRVLKEAVVQPDPFRLRYRTELMATVREIVRSGQAPHPLVLEMQAGRNNIPSADRETFVNTALGLLIDLHDGAISRYGIRPSEFRAWSDAVRVSPR